MHLLTLFMLDSWIVDWILLVEFLITVLIYNSEVGNRRLLDYVQILLLSENMSFEILEYPIKRWILDAVHDEKINSELFDLLGEPDTFLKYPSIILYDIDNLVDHNTHNLVVRLGKVDRDDGIYMFDLKNFSSCRKVVDQLIGILNDSNVLLKMIVGSMDEKWVKMFELDKLYITLMNGFKLKLCYEGNHAGIQEQLSSLYLYGFHSEIEYNDSDADDSDDDVETVKKILDELVADIKP